MDSNGLKFWMLSGSEDWALDDNASWDEDRRVLRLASRRSVQRPAQDKASARAAAERVRTAVDAFGAWAMVSPDGRTVTAAGAFPHPVKIHKVGSSERILDLAAGPEGVLWLVVRKASGESHALMVDLLKRWEPVRLSRTDLQADRILARPSGGAWLVDRKHKKAARITGIPFPEHIHRDFSPQVGRPCVENPGPPQVLDPVDLPVPAEWELVSAAISAEGRLAFLFWVKDAEAQVLIWDEDTFFPPDALRGLTAPFSIGWVERDRWASLLEGARDAPVFRLPTNAGKGADPVGSLYPLPGWDGGPFCNGWASPVHYLEEQAASGAMEARVQIRPKPLHRLSHPFLTTHAVVRSARVLDSGDSKTVWHRLYLEGVLPPGTGLQVRLAAGNGPEPPPPERFVPVLFGAVPADPAESEARAVARGAWVPVPSEIPFHEGFLDCPPQKDRAGLFTALIQKPSGRVRRLQGRFLWVEMELWGTGQASPEVAALRVYAPRFSYRDRYLPEIYQEPLVGSEAEAEGDATGADFLERFLCLFEGILTPLEDRVAAAHVLTDPDAAPSEALEWLASWIGVSLEPAFSLPARRRLLREAGLLFREHGTLVGMIRALDVATEGAVRRGRIVVVEDFRLRRTFSTLLGADLDDTRDPLTLGVSTGGNSRVGRSLFLGAEEQREFLALFRPGVPDGEDEEEVTAAFHDAFAHRVTILVHTETAPETVDLVRRVAALEAPAHVDVRIAAASENLVAGIASLLGVDTAPGKRAPLSPVCEDASRLGRDSSLLDTPSLDPRFD
ncbi:phage tail protein domain-containing protein [Desulfacinum infernum DSM 9756]|uniref:Phage tail protein domain-containing protein n=1 Tax=Desulfacinum infernum DSM 9756 TaxID=1121391 RepID=A0A1M4WMB6_9BACT|nr:phage tail protein [Desulfacinum infernum]SHE82112.1 phage tail protein domain-containing protein [Desulfacinum infernum DSM 9756]